MSLATQEDVQAWLGRGLTTAEENRVAALLARADALILGYLGCATAPDPVPDAVRWTAAEVVSRLFTTSGAMGVRQVSTDDTAVTYTSESSGGSVWLSPADKMALRPHRCGGGLTSVRLVSDRYTITEDES